MWRVPKEEDSARGAIVRAGRGRAYGLCGDASCTTLHPTGNDDDVSVEVTIDDGEPLLKEPASARDDSAGISPSSTRPVATRGGVRARAPLHGRRGGGRPHGGLARRHLRRLPPRPRRRVLRPRPPRAPVLPDAGNEHAHLRSRQSRRPGSPRLDRVPLDAQPRPARRGGIAARRGGVALRRRGGGRRKGGGCRNAVAEWENHGSRRDGGHRRQPGARVGARRARLWDA